jgi:pyruvate/2-oxoglutarate dehydrogenase complex dihydrolipoamide acyltransferase (E2) component
VCEVFTDKLVAKIPSTHDGIIRKINFGNDTLCPVGHALIEIETSEEGEETAKPIATAPAEVAKQE